MKLDLRQGLIIVVTVIVGLIGIAMFALAGTPMTSEASTAQAWVEALCEGRLSDLFRLSAVPDGVDEAEFVTMSQTYLESGEVPQPCVGQVNLNLVRTSAVPSSLSGSVERVRVFNDVELIGESAGQRAMLPLWVYLYADGHSAVWANYFAATPELPVALGESATLVDANGLLVGYAGISAPVKVYQTEQQTLIGIDLDLQTVSRPWEWYTAQLFVDGKRATPIGFPDQLPEEWRGGMLNPNGEYTPQNLQFSGTFWFSADSDGAMMLAFTARPPFGGTMRAAYMDVPVDVRDSISPFDPFSDARMVITPDGNVVFETVIDMTGLDAPELILECGRFALVLASADWLRPIDCAFPEGGSQHVLAGERLNVRVTFGGANVTADQIESLMYRRQYNNQTIRYVLWEGG